MKEYKIFELGESKINGEWTETEIIGLNEIYNKYKDPVSGAVGLLHADDEHPGCCQMYYTWRSQPDKDGELTIEFYPAYTENGDYILIKTPDETPYVIFCSRFTSYDVEGIKNGRRTGYLDYKTNGWNS